MKKGFTLIELLIVVALLGALVIGLLTALDPIEQINRGRDTGLRNTSSEFFNALNRYYTGKAEYPWTSTGVLSQAASNTLGANITTLINAGELKTNFYTRAGTASLNKILVTSANPSDLAICFQPTSKAMQNDPATIYDAAGATAANCKGLGAGGTVNCYMCFR